MTVIQWYPGHMAKALRQVKENLNAVDIVLELVDARLPESSRNPQLEELLQNKKSIIVLTKMDLADPKLDRILRAKRTSGNCRQQQPGHASRNRKKNQGSLKGKNCGKRSTRNQEFAHQGDVHRNSERRKVNPSQSIGKEKRRNRRQQARGHQGAAMAESRFTPVAA